MTTDLHQRIGRDETDESSLEAQHCSIRDDDDPVGPEKGTRSGSAQICNQIYNSRKPKWWYRLSASTSKAQKRAMCAILDTLRLPIVQHGHFYEWRNIFPAGNDIWIEVGFGRGENLLALAHRMQNDPVSLIGMEMHQSGVGTTCQRILKGLEIGGYWTDYTLYSMIMGSIVSSNKCGSVTCDDVEQEVPNDNLLAVEASTSSTDTPKDDPYKNLRLWPGDGIKVLSKIPESSIASLLLTFPDPFPEDREAEWRVVQLSTLKEIYRVLRKTPSRPGRLFLATDHEGFRKWSLECVKQFNTDVIMLELVEPCPDRLEWLPAVSRYEQKGWDEGRQTQLCCWMARNL